MERIDLNIATLQDSPQSPNLQDKPSEEQIWDAVYEVMTKNSGKEYLNHILSYVWQEKSPTRLLTASEKSPFKTGVLTWYVKVYVK